MSSDQHNENLTPLLSEKQIFENLFDKFPEAFVIINNDEHIVKINFEFTRLFGYSESETLGKTLDELLVPPTLVSEGRKINAAVKEGNTYSLETIRQKKKRRSHQRFDHRRTNSHRW